MNNTNTISNSHKCNDCGCDLILIEVVTMTLGNNLYPITKSTFKCSNKACQEEADKKAAKKLELKRELDESRAKRAQDSLNLKMQESLKVKV